MMDEAQLKSLLDNKWHLTQATGQAELEKVYHFKTYTKVAVSNIEGPPLPLRRYLQYPIRYEKKKIRKNVPTTH